MLNRSSVLAVFFIAGASFLPACQGGHKAAAPTGTQEAPTPASSLHRLMDGNERFASGHSIHPDTSAARRAELTSGQKPFAIVLACADSRVGPEVVFDQGLGDIFVVRLAGNVADDAAIASIEYGVEHLHAPLVVVMGHSQCGAVKATMDFVASGQAPPGHLAALVDAIRPAVNATRASASDPVQAAVDANIRDVVGQLRASKPVLEHMVAGGEIKVVGGRYDLNTGRFVLIDNP